MERPNRLVHDTLLSAAEGTADKTAVISAGMHVDYGSFAGFARSLAGTFQEQGLRRGDRVAIVAENGWPVAVATYATWLAGGVVMVINPQTKAEKLSYILQDSGARLAVIDLSLIHI